MNTQSSRLPSDRSSGIQKVKTFAQMEKEEEKKKDFMVSQKLWHFNKIKYADCWKTCFVNILILSEIQHAVPL